MTLKKIEAIEKKIQEASQVDAKSKEDLLDLMSDLKNELAHLKKSHANSAHDIADKTQTSTEQILDKDSQKEQLQKDIDGLQLSVEEFEVSHPKLVQIINRLCMMLSDIGI